MMLATVPSVLNNAPNKAPINPNTTVPMRSPFTGSTPSSRLNNQPNIAPKNAPRNPYVFAC